MYYKEEWINGELCYRVTPGGKWIPFTIDKYKIRLLKLEDRLLQSEILILELEEKIKRYENPLSYKK